MEKEHENGEAPEVVEATASGLSAEPHEPQSNGDAEPIILEPKIVEPDWKSKYLYMVAELENVKKRFARERLELIQNSNEKLLLQIFPVLDNLELAMKAVKEAEARLENSIKNNSVYKNMVLGVDMTLKHFRQTLEQVGVKALESVGKGFDPAQHEAMGETTHPEFNDGAVVNEVQKGYTLFGRVIRVARVLVNKRS